MTRADLARERRRLGMQLEVRELAAIVDRLRPPQCLLVFGLGRDASFWKAQNPGGRTVFLEDDPGWLAAESARDPMLEAYLVDYRTRRSEWRALLDAGESLRLTLPDAIAAIAWDVVFVDGPASWRDSSPGRMRSLYTASRIVKPGGDVFVHDAERDLERAYLRRYFANFSLVREVAGRAALRHYRADGRPWSARSLWGARQLPSRTDRTRRPQLGTRRRGSPGEARRARLTRTSAWFLAGSDRVESEAAPTL